MKKFIVGFISIIMVFLMVSCSSYTCPAYSKYAAKKQVKVRYR
ncbi:hypothetical protein C900_05073 [Fulvivirga imtechensis AK7]|uniref:Lipoprotein n=1 Tax=Fulvivirga imtechensis AK7 TaxID=1237149 RepID=L8JME0_9BACT|nr:hypothetical protein C900_05073 [Fulvivirga imtechensis AK7]